MYKTSKKNKIIKKTKKCLKYHGDYSIMLSDKGVREEIHTQSVSFWHLFCFNRDRKKEESV